MKTKFEVVLFIPDVLSLNLLQMSDLSFLHLNGNQIVSSVQRISSLATVLIRLILSLRSCSLIAGLFCNEGVGGKQPGRGINLSAPRSRTKVHSISSRRRSGPEDEGVHAPNGHGAAGRCSRCSSCQPQHNLRRHPQTQSVLHPGKSRRAACSSRRFQGNAEFFVFFRTILWKI